MRAALPVGYLAPRGEIACSITGRHTGRMDLPLTPRGEEGARAAAG
jgi:broad specificity phosphatase PhoE